MQKGSKLCPIDENKTNVKHTPIALRFNSDLMRARINLTRRRALVYVTHKPDSDVRHGGMAILT